MASVLFKFGNQAAYNALSPNYDTNSLYFIEDTGRLYKGAVLMGEQAIFTTSVPAFAEAVAERIYVVVAGDKVSLYVKGATEMVQAGGGTVEAGAITNINAFGDSVITKVAQLAEGKLPADDNTVPTSGAVQGAIDTAVDAVKTNLQGQIDALDPKVKAALNGVSIGTAEDPNKFRLVFTRTEGDPVNIDLDKERYLQSAEVSEDGTKLVLTIITASGEPTVLEIPLSELTKVDASTVNTTTSITVTTPVGNFTKGQVIEIDSIQDILVSMLTKDSNPTTSQPSTTITLTGAGAKEVGTEFTPSYSVAFNGGSYSANKEGAQPTGVTVTGYEVTDTSGGTATTQTGSFDAFTVEDGTNYKVSVTTSYGDGNIPTTFLGTPYPAGQIKASSKSDDSTAVTGFRNCWWGYKTAANKIANATEITLAEVKALGNVNRTKPTTFNNIPAGMVQMFFAVPATQATKLEVTQSNPVSPVTVRGPITLQIGGVGNHSPIAYKIFYTEDGATIATQNYTLKWS